MNEAACSWRTITGLILLECLSAIMAPAAFSPAPPKAASTPTLSNALTIASYTRIGRAPKPPEEHRDGSAIRLRPMDAKSIDRLERFNRKSHLFDLRQSGRGNVRFCRSKAVWPGVFSKNKGDRSWRDRSMLSA